MVLKSIEFVSLLLDLTGVHSLDTLKEIKIENTSNKNIHFINKQLDVRPFHAVADLFVIPTKKGEGIGVAPIEAMSSQRIVIGSRVIGIKEVLRNFDICMFEAKNSNSIKDKILMIQSMTSKARIDLAKKMRKDVENTFSLKECVNNHEEFYFSLNKK